MMVGLHTHVKNNKIQKKILDYKQAKIRKEHACVSGTQCSVVINFYIININEVKSNNN